MSEIYKVIATDGKEYGPIDEQKLKTWFQEQRVSNTTLVFVSSRSQWDKLENIFNLRQWEGYTEPPVIEPLVIEPIYPLSTSPDINNSSAITPLLQDNPQVKKLENNLQSSSEQATISGNLGWFPQIVIGIILFCLINIIFFVLTNGYVILNPFLHYAIVLGVAAWISKIINKKRMEKRLGRKLWGEYELTSLNSWMEVEDKENKNKSNKES